MTFAFARAAPDTWRKFAKPLGDLKQLRNRGTFQALIWAPLVLGQALASEFLDLSIGEAEELGFLIEFRRQLDELCNVYVHAPDSIANLPFLSGDAALMEKNQPIYYQYNSSQSQEIRVDISDKYLELLAIGVGYGAADRQVIYRVRFVDANCEAGRMHENE